MNLEAMIAGIKLEHPLMNAAGTCKSLEDVKVLSHSATAAIMVGSITVEARLGNVGDVYWAGDLYSLNSLGLPNRGADFYKEELPYMVAIANGEGKPLFVSAAGFSPDEYAQLASLAFHAGADLVELNLGCPNVWKDGEQKRIACFDPQLVGEILRQVESAVGTEAKVSVKISPFSDPFALEEVAKVIRESWLVKAVTTSNTFPNAFGFNGTERRITPAGGLAGFAGRAMKPIGLGQVRQLRILLPARIGIIGVGGITFGQDILEYMWSGALVTQVATAYLEGREHVFNRLLSELLDVVEV